MNQLAGAMGVSGLAINRLVGRGESPKRVPLGQNLQLGKLDSATGAADMNLPGRCWHPLKGDLAGCWAVWVDGNWRLTFKFEGKDAVLVDYRDYH